MFQKKRFNNKACPLPQLFRLFHRNMIVARFSECFLFYFLKFTGLLVVLKNIEFFLGLNKHCPVFNRLMHFAFFIDLQTKIFTTSVFTIFSFEFKN